MDFIKKRLKEKSTFAGIAFILGIAGVTLTQDKYQAIAAVIAAAIGALEIFRKEKD